MWVHELLRGRWADRCAFGGPTVAGVKHTHSTMKRTPFPAASL